MSINDARISQLLSQISSNVAELESELNKLRSGAAVAAPQRKTTKKAAAPQQKATSPKAATKKAATSKPAKKAAANTSAEDSGKPGMSGAIREVLRRNRGPMAVNDIIAHVDGKSRSVPKDLSKAVSATLSNMIKGGHIVRVDVGVYALS